MELYPLTFTPVLKDYLWGGRNLERLGRNLPDEGVIAESWEIAAHEDGASVVKNGRFAGTSLTEIHAKLGIELTGRRCTWAEERGKFPLLIKLLDASRPLSVQVHPQDEYALAHEGNELGKTEMWVVLDAEPGAEVILGVKSGTTPDAFRQAISDGRLEPFLHYVAVQAGDHICVPAGSLHAIMGGLLIAEIQQNSNTTYRVYDWNRAGADGRPRTLHVDKALDVINFAQVEPQLHPPQLIEVYDGISREWLCQNRYFTAERITMEKDSVFEGECTGETLEIWGTIAGSAEVNAVSLPAVNFALLPAALGKYSIRAHSAATLLRTYVQ
jgi:mannose-6-phosphate isomerase